MEIQETSQGAVTVLKPDGPLTGADAEAFKLRALEVSRRTLGRIILDASAIAFVDSAGLESLVDVTEQLSQGGRSLKLCMPGTTLKEVLELTGWADQFEYFDDVTTGVRSFL